MSLKRKLLLGLILLCACLGTISAVNYWGLSNVRAGYSKLVDQSVPKLGDISGMRARAAQVRADLYKVTLNITHEKIKDETIKTFQKNIKRYQEIEEEYAAKGFFSVVEKKEFAKVQILSKEVTKAADEVISLVNKGDQSATSLRLNLADETFSAHQKELKTLDDHIVDTSLEWTKSSEAIAKKTEFFGIMFALMTLIGVSIGLLLFSKKLNQTLTEIAEKLNSTSSKVEQQSADVADVSQGLSSSTNQQASALQETVAAATQVASMIKTTSDNTFESCNKVKKSHQATQSGQSAVDDLLNAIQEITNANAQLEQQVEFSNTELKEIIQLIEGINTKTKVINDIVFQTKILAFNASVEAARAGEAGKGFSVVAEEVSKLSSMSGKAAEEIKILLDKSNSRVREIVESSTDNVKKFVSLGETKVTNGRTHADSCKHVLGTISLDINDLLMMNNQISEAAKEQSVGMEEINKALGQIEMGTAHNVEATEKCSLAARELKSQATETKVAVSQLLEIIYGKSA